MRIFGAGVLVVVVVGFGVVVVGFGVVVVGFGFDLQSHVKVSEAESSLKTVFCACK